MFLLKIKLKILCDRELLDSGCVLRMRVLFLTLILFLAFLSSCAPFAQSSPQGSVTGSLCERIRAAVDEGTFKEELAQKWYGFCF